ncbi:DUF4105 domain-containing protein [Allopusillimonas soli]|uniref:DUF4105 domain-containing protein n=1 Tax=Allopusillimonas soli TaxID=659016 RepID=A0A853F788_9BURK|nr:DUF4105 domain-containing protein [Allopusillimonas soli]NYT35963.1 DUF4105 domain-containing protein [Allopusillimonas soli]TEA76310.1 DUF4105 domain-containing protein [Allopusillimonas soli]
MSTLPVVIGIIIGLTAMWGALALYIRLPAPRWAGASAAAVWLVLAAAALAGTASGQWWLAYAYGAVLSGLLAWWHSIRPAGDRDWIPEVARQTHGVVQGDWITLRNVRNFAWRSRSDFTPRWETRRYAISRLQSVDLTLSYWGHRSIAHALVSFGFLDEDGRNDYVVFSVEIRRKKGDRFSEIGGFFRQYELSLIASTEEDSLRARTNVRGEDCYLYRVHMPREAAGALFLAYVNSANRLLAQPRFYNTLTANCITIVFRMAQQIVPGLPMDYRLLLSGYLDGYLYDLGALQGANSLPEYRRRGRYTDRARAARDAVSYSASIRRGVPGINAEV